MSISPRTRRRRQADVLFRVLCTAAAAAAVVLLVLLLWGIVRDGAGALSLEFLQSFPSRFPSRAGIKSALYGTAWLMVFTALFAIPVGVATAVYLEEFAVRNRLTRTIQVNISNLAGVPAIVYGILGLAVFVRGMQLGRGVLAGALTMALLILPVIIIAAQEALRAVPVSLRHASLALGATQWQTVRHQVLPVAMPGIMTGVILALSRALGEAAPLITLGALTYVAFVPRSLQDPFTTLPIQIFNWASRPQAGFHHLAAAAILVLLVVLLSMNALAIFLRERYRLKIRD
jgi:phosphate transport system permease protein